jgi:hypothetical protein
MLLESNDLRRGFVPRILETPHDLGFSPARSFHSPVEWLGSIGTWTEPGTEVRGDLLASVGGRRAFERRTRELARSRGVSRPNLLGARAWLHVTHDARLHGALSGGDRQIDVLIESPSLGTRVVVDCKDWARRADVNDSVSLRCWSRTSGRPLG